MPRTKTKRGETVRFQVNIGGGAALIVESDEWLVAMDLNKPLVFFLAGELMLTVAAHKWDYVRRLTVVTDGEDEPECGDDKFEMAGQ